MAGAPGLRAYRARLAPELHSEEVNPQADRALTLPQPQNPGP
jgi:hypothetical protein